MIPVTLRDVVADDIPIFYRHQSDAAAAQMAQVAQRDEAAYLAHWTGLLADETVGKMAVVVKGVVAGQVISFSRDGVRELGYWLGREYWGQGIAGAAVEQYLALERHRPLFVVVAEHNSASRAILRRCGFREVRREGSALRFELSGALAEGS